MVVSNTGEPNWKSAKLGGGENGREHSDEGDWCNYLGQEGTKRTGGQSLAGYFGGIFDM